MLDQFRLNPHLNGWLLFACVLLLAACGSNGEEGGAAFRATLPPQQEANAPVYTATPTLTATATPTLTVTPSLTPTLTLTATPSPTPTPTLTVTPTVSPTPTIPLHTLTPASFAGAPPAYNHRPAEFTTPEGWSCGDFPCADDIDGFLRRIQVPRGYSVSHAGRFPGQPMQITYGPDHRLYATVLLDGTREGAVFALAVDDENGQATQAAVQIGPRMISPVGLAFQPGTDVLYVSARLTPESGGVLYRLLMDGTLETVRDDLPCCLDIIDNQPAGMVFGPDGYLYLGVGSLTDHAESTQPESQPFAIVRDDEAAVLRIQPHTGETSVYARGIRYPYDVTFDSSGQMFATDSGVLEGPGDRVLAVDEGAHYGWPWYRTRGCADCPARDFSVDLQPDLLALPPYTLPRGIVAYTGQQFPVNVFDSLFIALWHGTPNAQRVIRVEPASVANNPEALDPYGFIPEPFVTGLIRPVDLTIAPDGSLIVADFIYGHIWRIRYTRGESDPAISPPVPGAGTPVPGAGTPV